MRYIVLYRSLYFLDGISHEHFESKMSGQLDEEGNRLDKRVITKRMIGGCEDWIEGQG